jgi:hypothetical protein
MLLSTDGVATALPQERLTQELIDQQVEALHGRRK